MIYCASIVLQRFSIFHHQIPVKLSTLVDSLEAERRACVPLRGHHVNRWMYQESAWADIDCQIYLTIAALTKNYKYEKETWIQRTRCLRDERLDSDAGKNARLWHVESLLELHRKKPSFRQSTLLGWKKTSYLPYVKMSHFWKRISTCNQALASASSTNDIFEARIIEGKHDQNFSLASESALKWRQVIYLQLRWCSESDYKLLNIKIYKDIKIFWTQTHFAVNVKCACCFLAS